jgi:hypothetical protein
VWCHPAGASLHEDRRWFNEYKGNQSRRIYQLVCPPVMLIQWNDAHILLTTNEIITCFGNGTPELKRSFGCRCPNRIGLTLNSHRAARRNSSLISDPGWFGTFGLHLPWKKM